jgi:hypothetical protein
MRTNTLLAIILIVLLVMLALLIIAIIGFRQREVELACGPELVKNGSFESGPNPGVVLLTTKNNCASTGGPCLENWNVGGGADRNPLQWYQNENGNPVPRASEGKQYLDLSGQFHKDLFPAVTQRIHLDAGRYELRFDVGQGNSPPTVFGPVSVDVGIRGAVTGNQPPAFTTDKGGPSWQTFAWLLTSGGGDIELVFEAHSRQTTAFIGLDTVSLRQLKPVGACMSR